MTWGPDDWSWWIRHESQDRSDAPAPQAILRRILTQVAGRRAASIGYLGAADPARVDFLATQFEHTFLLSTSVRHSAESVPRPGLCGVGSTPYALEDPGPLLGRLDVLLAVSALACADPRGLDLGLERARRCLVEGGLLLATFPATGREAVGRELRLEGAGVDRQGVELHEFELQYRLRRAGFRGVRIRRLDGDGDGSGDTTRESLLCVAVRRANN